MRNTTTTVVMAAAAVLAAVIVLLTCPGCGSGDNGDGDKLAENWIFIDMLHWMMQQGVDVLERTRQILRR